MEGPPWRTGRSRTLLLFAWRIQLIRNLNCSSLFPRDMARSLDRYQEARRRLAVLIEDLVQQVLKVDWDRTDQDRSCLS